ncbi:MAG TPA: DUF3267 domain-containing protein [Ktedonobacterales bacterium]
MSERTEFTLETDISSTGQAADADPRGMRLVARLLSIPVRQRLVAAIRSGRLREIDCIDLLAEENLPQLARRGAWLLAVATVGFVGLDVAASIVHRASPLPGGSAALQIGAVIAGNIAGYVVMVPVHEAVHAAMILALSGRPRFGLKLPFAAYCTAPDQLFTRNGYIAVALAPLVALTAAGIVATWLAPHVGAYLVLGLAGNVSGAVGDLVAVERLRRLPARALIADTQVGYTAYQASE